VFLFSATSSNGILKIVRSIFEKVKFLRFQSEFEIVHSVSAVDSGEILPCLNEEQLLEKLEHQIYLNYDERPIIIFSTIEIQAKIKAILVRRSWARCKEGTSKDALSEIRSWNYGILLLSPEDAVGVNTRFAMDSVVLITNRMADKAQY
jgi:hypothetical protein